MTTYNTNLAAEFYVLSMLHRLGAEANLTLGNKKAVDILVARGKGKAFTVDVKGVAGPNDWPADNIRLPAPSNHFYALVSFEGKIGDPDAVPSTWIVPGSGVAAFIKRYKVRCVVSRALVKVKGQRYRNAWRQIVGDGAA
ncbi:MAG TPA: hypothetical protein VEM13_04510 [Gemmatimonadales bacterium]|nr:hypothetical protein [Gemmatimonadales bacterium]